MGKKYSIKFWVIFWIVSIIISLSWFVFLEYKNNNYTSLISIIRPVVKVMPINSTQKKEFIGILDIIRGLSEKKNNTFLLLFQDRDELRPGGGYIDYFGILKIKKGRVMSIDIYDTNIFDSQVTTRVDPPKIMTEQLGIKDLELRDSNWSPDFKINAKQADYFYHLEGGQERIDGVIALSSKLLGLFLEVIGPIRIKGYPEIYNSENIVAQLEYQAEKNYQESKIGKGKQEDIIKEMSRVIVKKMQSLSWKQKRKLYVRVKKHLNEKDILIYFKNTALQQRIKNLGWSGEINIPKNTDFLMIVDANLGSRKSDAVMDREFEYTVDFRQKKPTAELKIKYTHKGKVRDLLTDDYRAYLRVLVPSKSWLYNTEGLSELDFVDFNEIFNLKSFGIFYKINLGKSKTINFRYYLPVEFKLKNYQLFIQKQSGVNRLIGKVRIIDKMGIIKSYNINSTKDVKIKNISPKEYKKYKFN